MNQSQTIRVLLDAVHPLKKKGRKKHKSMHNEAQRMSEELTPVRESWDTDTDKWFDHIAELSEQGTEDPGLRALEIIAGKAPTKTNFGKFMAGISKVRDSKAKSLLSNFTKAMSDGDYRKDFKNFVGGQVSQVSNLFGLYRQAISYGD